ncbi:unnamed protein product [Mytilus coruscus]|uniref:IgGFc-binding protein N-terminal domain-containing protein n=1 Tax=Mytilus coruscus TaxID=42192 RepID=A0A6J8BAS6_MYTCO|nr:unnamed protein product [Mytilus coruscus]
MGSIRNENHDLSSIEHDYISIYECNPAHVFDHQFPLQSRMIRDEDLSSRITDAYQGNSSDRLIKHKIVKASVCIVFIMCAVCCSITTAVLLTQMKQHYPKKYDGSVGDEFILAFFNIGGMSANALYITSMHHGKCIINSQNIHSSIFVSPNTTSIYRFDNSQYLTESKSRKGVYILCNTKVSITAYSKINSKRAAFLLLPLQMLGKEYVVPSYMSTSDTYGHSSMFAVVAVHSDTLVNINIRSSSKRNVNFDNKGYLNESKIFINMTYLDTIEISEYKGDLSGTYINSSKPVAVISGHTCVFMRNSYCGRLMEMIIASKDFSKRFIIPKLERPKGAKLRAYAYVKTDIVCTYLNKSNISFSLHPTDFLELDYENLTTVRATENIYIQLYKRLFGGASMTTVPGINQYLAFYMFFVPYGYQYNYLSIIIRSDGIKGIRINNKDIETLQNRTFVLIGIQYTTFVYRIFSGRHTAEQIQNIPFGLFVFAENHSVNFGYLAGMSMLSFNGTG